ncbi:hypothetical protein SGLAM104S_02413 [Streptomyces glaucescens]
MTFTRFYGGHRTMRSIRTPATPQRRRRTVLAATGLVAALALTATACNGSDEQRAADQAGATASQGADGAGDSAGDNAGEGKIGIPSDIAGLLRGARHRRRRLEERRLEELGQGQVAQ